MGVHLGADAALRTIVVDGSAIIVMPFSVTATEEEVAVDLARSRFIVKANLRINYLNAGCLLASVGIEPRTN